jgi:hypothetical protein
MRSYWNRPLGSKLILLLGIALLAEMFAPWQRVCAITSSGSEPRVCGWRTAYQGSNYGLYAAGLCLIIVIWELLPVLIPRFSMRGWPTAIVTAVLSVLLVLSTLFKLIKDNEFQTFWAWIGFAIAIALMVTAILRVRHRWKHRDEPEPARPEPKAGAPPPQVEAPPAGGSSA